MVERSASSAQRHDESGGAARADEDATRVPARERERVGHWPAMARHWRVHGSPLRPVEPDLRFCQEAVAGWCGCGRAPRVLLLGVTPELYALPWPAGTDFLAVDRTRAMIEAVWPGPSEAVVCADWRALPLPADSRDLVLCDGGLHLLAYPHEQARLVRQLRGIVAPDGLCSLRLYVPPMEPERSQTVLEDLCAGRIRGVSALKLRLGMALQSSAVEGVRLAEVWDAYRLAVPDAAALGWSPGHLQAMDSYRDQPTRYHFVTLAEVTDLFTRIPGGFALERVAVPSYDLGERCPSVVFRRLAPSPGDDDGGLAGARP